MQGLLNLLIWFIESTLGFSSSFAPLASEACMMEKSIVEYSSQNSTTILSHKAIGNDCRFPRRYTDDDGVNVTVILPYSQVLPLEK